MDENFVKELNRSNPKEILLPLSLKKNEIIQNALNSHELLSVSYYPDWNFSYDYSDNKLKEQFGTLSLKSFGLNENSAEIVPAGFLLDYLSKTTNSTIPHVNSIKIYSDSDFLVMDNFSRKNLEITENLHDGSTQYTLLDCVNFTKTAMGYRLLRNWLLFPLTDVKQIESRQNQINVFFENKSILDKIRSDLSSILDIERLASRIAMNKAHPKDLQALKSSLQEWLKIKQYLCDFDFSFIDSKPAEQID